MHRTYLSTLLALLCLSFPLNVSGSPQEEAKSYMPLAEVEGELSAVVAGCVNVISGSYSIGSTDLSIVSCAPLTFERTYSSDGWSGGNMGAGWNSNLHDSGNIFGPRNYRRYFWFFPEPSGGTPPYVSDKDQKIKNGQLQEPNAITYFRLTDPALEYGMTNTGCGEICGRTNLKNQVVTFRPDSRTAELQLADGGVRSYCRCNRRKEQHFPMALIKEVRPNGKQIHYHYEGSTASVKTTDATGLRIYGSYQIDRSAANEKQGNIKVTGSDGRHVIYHCHPRKNKEDRCTRRLIHQAIPSDAPSETYTYDDDNGGPDRIIRKSLPEGRYQDIEYYHWESNNVGGTWVRLDHRYDELIFGRVRLLKEPVGHDETPIITHRFFYTLPTVHKDPGLFQTGSTVDVRDALNHRTVYTLQFDKRLREITRYVGSSETSYVPYSREYYFWGPADLNQNINLQAKVLYDGANTIRSVRHLAYDSKHNVVAETICGNLSGRNTTPIQLQGYGEVVSNGAERYTVRRTFSADRFNLKTNEILPNGRIISLRYKPDTDLLVAKLINDSERIFVREFIGYDAHGDVVRMMCDDGSSEYHENHTDITFRKITDYTLRQEAPAVGLPEVISERYMDPATGIEHLLSRKVNTYSKEGRLVSQAVYDADNQFCFILRWEYDAFGNVILEQNALGQLTQRTFDANGNKLFEQGPDPLFHMVYRYDFANRLISETRVCQGGVDLTHSYKYDYLGNKIASIDPLGHETRYRYDEFGRLIETIFPPCPDANGQLVSHSIRQAYDISGNVIALTDVNGNTTHKKYTIRGQTTEVIHPDGSSELSVYNLDGTLASQKAVNGTTTRLTYDILGNCIRKEIFSANDELLSASSSIYKGSNLISETDANGNITTYQHDAAGRPIGIIKGDTSIHYVYDSLGRKIKTTQRINDNPTNVRVTVCEYDLLNRVTEERIENGQGTIFTRTVYGYDAAGRRSSVTLFNDEGACTTQTTYTSQGQICRVVDAEGYETLSYYNYFAMNEHGQRVLEITSIDALGSATVTTHDVLGRAVLRVQKDLLNNEIARTAFYFDGKGNQIKRIDTVKANGANDRDVITEWRYDTLGRVVELIEAAGTPTRRQTFFSYNAYGQKQNEILADGVILSYSYDTLGRIECYAASDGSFAYRYTYDLVGNLLQVDDEKSGTTTSRTYDNANRLMTETLGNGLSVGYHYDGLSRVTRLDLPDNSAVDYTYDPCSLRAVSRIDSSGSTLYAHHYLTYDLTGHLIEAKMIGEAGDIACRWDKLCRLRSFKTELFQETIPSGGYDAVGSLVKKTRRDILGEIGCDYTYDARYQVTAESGQTPHTYRYDSLDNRISKDGEGCELDALNQILRQGDTTYTYDARGNRASKTHSSSSSYTYDALGRLTQVTKGTCRHDYIYDAFNRRLSKSSSTLDSQTQQWIPGPVERYLYREQMDIGAVDEQGHFTQLRVLGQGLGAEIGAAVSIEIGSNTYAPIHDHSGHVIALVDAATGELAEAYRYSVFGEEEQIAGDSLMNPWRFASKRVDPETGLLHFGRRYYDPELGRWLTPDPAGYQDGPNLYAYVHNRPLTHFDLYGLLTQASQGATCPRCGRPLPRQQPGTNNIASARRYVGDSLCSACWHMCPIGPLQRVGMAAARAIGGMGFSLPNFVGERSSSGWHSSFNPDNPPGDVMYISGQCNIYDECYGATREMSSLFGNCNFGFIHNASHGLISDLCESVALILGFQTNSLRECVSRIRMELSYRAEMGLDGPLYIHAHSQGGLLVYRALQQLDAGERSMLDVTTYGSAKIIGREGLHDCTNYIARTDIVPLVADPIGYVKAILGIYHNVRFVGSAIGLPGQDHAWKGGSYESVWAGLGNMRTRMYTGSL